MHVGTFWSMAVFFEEPGEVFFGLMDVHLLTRADVVLYFRQLFACRCDLITNAARNALDIYLLTPANVMLYFRPAFACRCDLIANCCPRLNTQRCNILQRSVKATLCLLQEHLHQSHLLLTPADNLANSLGLPGKRSRFGSQGGEIRALRHHWAAMRDLPVNSHATHVQHTCNTRATYVQHDVQHDVQHEHFYCKFTGKIAFSRLAATNPLCFHLKVRVGLRLPKNNILAAILQ